MWLSGHHFIRKRCVCLARRWYVSAATGDRQNSQSDTTERYVESDTGWQTWKRALDGRANHRFCSLSKQNLPEDQFKFRPVINFLISATEPNSQKFECTNCL